MTKQFDLDFQSGILHIDGFGEWGLSTYFKTGILELRDFPLWESWCDQDFVDAVNQEIDKALEKERAKTSLYC